MRKLIIMILLYLAGVYQSLYAENLLISTSKEFKVNGDLNVDANVSKKNTNDSLEYQMNRQYRLKIMTVSEDGRWAVVGKHYDRNKDTVMIVSHDLNNKKRFSMVGLNNYQKFLKNKALLSFGSGKAQYLDLKTGNKINYSGIKYVYVLSETGHYALLDNQEQVCVFDLDGKEMFRLGGIKGFPVSNGKDQWYGYRKNDNGYEVIDFSAEQAKILHQTKNAIQRITISDSQDYLLIIESDPLRSAENLVIIDPKTGKVMKPLDGVAVEGEYIALNETSQSGRWIITAERKVHANKNLEIWYGNDGHLNSHEKGFSTVRRYWVFDFPSNRLTVIPTDRFKNIMSTGNKNIFLAFNYGELQDYTSLLQNIHMHLYNTESREFIQLDTVKNASLYLPKEGSTLLYRSLNNKWQVFKTQNNTKSTIEETFLKNPLFTSDGKKIYFESDRGLFLYDLEINKLRDLKIGRGKQVKIINKKRNNQGDSFLNVSTAVVTDKVPILVEVKDRCSNTVSFEILHQDKRKTVIPTTPDYIREMYYSNKLDRIWYTQENYNKPTEIHGVEIETMKPKILIQPEKVDSEAAHLRNEIIKYKNSDGVPLKGVLFYPSKFDPAKKYPMIVRIYEIQNNAANQYYTSGYNDAIAFDLRVLVSKGYFVYLPDIVMSAKGAGLSALDCVNHSLDVLSDRSAIDRTKIGLIGHSHGAYETNFIATQSNRFAAYVSGAGNSDIVRSYFSYNYNFHSPFYWQYENGQYQMPASFAENKELYFKNNPIHYVEQISAPILLWAGKKDENIKWDQVMEFYIGLKRNKKEVIALFYPNQGHALGFGTAENKDLYARVLQWWDYFLKNKKNVGWIDQQMKNDAF